MLDTAFKNAIQANESAANPDWVTREMLNGLCAVANVLESDLARIEEKVNANAALLTEILCEIRQRNQNPNTL